jgi:hypothetical protein
MLWSKEISLAPAAAPVARLGAELDLSGLGIGPTDELSCEHGNGPPRSVVSGERLRRFSFEMQLLYNAKLNWKIIMCAK